MVKVFNHKAITENDNIPKISYSAIIPAEKAIIRVMVALSETFSGKVTWKDRIDYWKLQGALF